MTKWRRASVVMWSAAVVLASCSSTPAEDELTDAIYEDGKDAEEGELWIGRVNSGIGREGARCIAQVLLASEVSDEPLQAIVDQDAGLKLDTELQRDLMPIYGELGACMGVTGDPDQFFED